MVWCWSFGLSNRAFWTFFVIETLGYFLKNWAIFFKSSGHPASAVIMALFTLSILDDMHRQQRIDRLLIGLFTLVGFVFDNTSDITMWYCHSYLPWQLGSFLFLSCCPRWPRNVRKVRYCPRYLWHYHAKFCECKCGLLAQPACLVLVEWLCRPPPLSCNTTFQCKRSILHNCLCSKQL